MLKGKLRGVNHVRADNATHNRVFLEFDLFVAGDGEERTPDEVVKSAMGLLGSEVTMLTSGEDFTKFSLRKAKPNQLIAALTQAIDDGEITLPEVNLALND